MPKLTKIIYFYVLLFEIVLNDDSCVEIEPNQLEETTFEAFAIENTDDQYASKNFMFQPISFNDERYIPPEKIKPIVKNTIKSAQVKILELFCLIHTIKFIHFKGIS